MCTELTPYLPCVSPTREKRSSLIDNSCFFVFMVVCNEVDGMRQETATYVRCNQAARKRLGNHNDLVRATVVPFWRATMVQQLSPGLCVQSSAQQRAVSKSLCAQHKQKIFALCIIA